MASAKDWVEGLRLRTLPAAVAPVILGSAFAFDAHKFSLIRATLAALVALLLQIGVNFANDYSDGIRGTDDFRQGPPRLTGGGKTSPKKVLAAALGSFGLAALAGLSLLAISGYWWLLAVGAAAIVAAWFYTGGKNPYGYMGLGEVFVMVFFGYVATVGTAYVQTGTTTANLWIGATAIGLVACALLMVNNIRDIPSDVEAGKRTLAVRLGDRKARYAFVAMICAPLLTAVIFAPDYPILVGLIGLTPWVSRICEPVLEGSTGMNLIPVLKQTGLFELAYAVAVAVGIVVTNWVVDPTPLTMAGFIIAGLGIVAILLYGKINDATR